MFFVHSLSVYPCLVEPGKRLLHHLAEYKGMYLQQMTHIMNDIVLIKQN